MAISALSRLDKRGGSRVVTNAGRDAVDARRRRGRWLQGGQPVSGSRRAGRTTLTRTAKPCGSGIRGWCQAAGGEFDPTGSISHQAGSDGGKRNSSPGRARHKPLNHCAGNAGVPRLYLYARVRISLHHCTRDRRCSKHPAFPAPSHLRDKEFQQASGTMRRENANAHSVVVTREGG